jgi:beta-lactam-binding protein with PASTA domain
MVMPDLAGVRRTARHRVDSALLTLLRLGVDFGRIVLEAAGPGEAEGAVISQEPAPGTELSPVSRIALRVGGSGGLDLMPFPLRDESDTEFRAAPRHLRQPGAQAGLLSQAGRRLSRAPPR